MELAADEKLCPYCGETIKAKAKKCRHCGEWLEEKTTAATPQTQTTASNSVNYKLIGVLAIVVAVLLIVFLTKGKESTSSKEEIGVEEEYVEAPVEAVEAAEEYVSADSSYGW